MGDLLKIETFIIPIVGGKTMNKLLSSIILVILLPIATTAIAADKVVVIPLFTAKDKAFPAKTGQATCYNESGTIISCIGTGQDGEYQKGVTDPPTRFIDNGDGTITDQLTDLMWLKDANCMKNNYPGVDTFNTPNGWVLWRDALAFVGGINSGTYPLCSTNYTDWRLPNIRELLSLIDYNNSYPALPSNHPFTSLESFYWSSTSYTYIKPVTKAWYMDFREGVTVGIDGNKASEDYPVWPVRGGL